MENSLLTYNKLELLETTLLLLPTPKLSTGEETTPSKKETLSEELTTVGPLPTILTGPSLELTISPLTRMLPPLETMLFLQVILTSTSRTNKPTTLELPGDKPTEMMPQLTPPSTETNSDMELLLETPTLTSEEERPLPFLT